MSPNVPDSQYRLLMHLSEPATTTNCSGFGNKVEKMVMDLLTGFSTQMTTFQLYTVEPRSIVFQGDGENKR
jgi:hypothetical protein